MMNPAPLGDMPLNTFLSKYWQKKPLLIRNAIPNVTPPVAADVLAGLACEEEVESRIVMQDIISNEWKLKHGPFNDEYFSTLPASHWTLLVQAVDHWLPEAAKFLDLFTFIPRWRIDDLMVSYASDGGGVGPHFDNYDVFLVQTNGKRKWQVGTLYDESSSLIDNLPVSILSEFKAVDTWVLEPGDILYVPPGFGHNGIAVGDDCITCSVGFRAPSHSEILREFTDHISEDISDTLRYSDADLIKQSNTGEVSSQAITKVQKILQHYIQDTDSVNDWFGRYMTMPKYPQDNDISLSLSNDAPDDTYNLKSLTTHLAAGGKLIRNESSRFAYICQPENHFLFVDGENISNLSNVNPLIETLCSKIEINNEMFPQTDNNFNLLLMLLQRGALYASDT
ncbi:MAG: cupin domain-containing protein [Gammaproteobacteria bacterium]